MTLPFGGNIDEYSGREKMWKLASKHNNQSLQLNGAYTCKRVRQVKQTKQLPLT